MVKAMSSRPHSASRRAQALRTGDTAAGSDRTSHSAIRSGSSRRVRATSSAMSSLCPLGSIAPITAAQVSSGVLAGPDRAAPSAARAASTSRSLFSSRPSVKSTSWAPSGTVTVAVSMGMPAPRPSGGETGSSGKDTVPSGSTTARPGWPAVAAVTCPETES